MNNLRLSKDEFVNELNGSILKLSQSIDYEKLSPSYAEMSYDDARRNLIFHRMFKKFEQPDEKQRANVADMSVADVLDHDENIDFDITRFSRLPVVVKRNVYRLRAALLADCETLGSSLKLSITTGENVVSARGDTSVYSKLSDRSKWTCSVGNIQRAVSLIRHQRYLKRAMMAHYDSLLWDDYIKRRSVLSISQVLSLPRNHWRKFRQRHYSFMFKTHGKNVLRAFFLKVATFVDYARITTVPKDNEVARVIIACPLFDMMLQRADANNITNMLKVNYGVDIGFAQNVHRNRLLDMRNATVDLKNASNSTHYDAVHFLIGKSNFFRKMVQSRNAYAIYKKEWHFFKMYAPMGCGTTFELMTWILLAACRLFDENAVVFGDDIIIRKDSANELIELLAALGYKTNLTKTFVSGHFRESCGAFASHGKLIKCFDFEWAADYHEAVILMNKLRLVRKDIPVLEALYSRMLQHLPLLTFKMADEDHPVLDDGVPSSINLVRQQRKHSNYVALFNAIAAKCDYVRRSARVTQYYLREILIKKSQPLWEDERIDDVSVFLAGHYMYAMRASAPTLRNTEQVQSKIVLCEKGNNLPVTFQ